MTNGSTSHYWFSCILDLSTFKSQSQNFELQRVEYVALCTFFLLKRIKKKNLWG